MDKLQIIFLVLLGTSEGISREGTHHVGVEGAELGKDEEGLVETELG